MATAGFNIAEAHVMRKLHKEKMMRMEEEERAMAGAGTGTGAGAGGSPVKKSSRCLRIFKKVHPSQVVVNSAREEEEAGKRDSKGL